MRPRIGSGAVAVLAGLAIVTGIGFAQAPAPSEPKPAPTPAVTTPRSSGTLMLIGGGTIPESMRRRFVELAGGPSARVLIIPASANGDEPNRARYALAPWRELGVGTFDLLHARSREEADDPAFVAPIDQATGIWFGGGQQGFLADRYVGTLLQQRVRDLLARGGTVGGTSAGAAIASRVMITGGRGQPQEGTGLGFLDDVVVDQHFLKRNRVDRLLTMIVRHPDQIGVGIDESTALVISLADRKAQVLGESYVAACGPGDPDGRPRMRYYKAGDELAFDDWKRAEVAAATAGGGR